VLAGAAGLSIGASGPPAAVAVHGRPAGTDRRALPVARLPFAAAAASGFRIRLGRRSGRPHDEAVEASSQGQLCTRTSTAPGRPCGATIPRSSSRRSAARARLWGAEDVQLPLDDAFEYTRRLQRDCASSPGCGHLLIGERPGACADANETFLRDSGLEGHHLPA
jgi:pimeloyl-ACP methyl ester carboxylesterase